MDFLKNFVFLLFCLFILACEPDSTFNEMNEEQDLCPHSQVIECGPNEMVITTINENECEVLSCSEMGASDCPQVSCEYPNYQVGTELDENQCEIPVCEPDPFHDEACGHYTTLAQADYVCAQENLVPAYESCDQIECITVTNTHPCWEGEETICTEPSAEDDNQG